MTAASRFAPVSLDALRLEVHRSGYDLRTIDGPDMLGCHGLTDADRRVVWVAGDLTAREMRSTLAHEIVHARLQHGFTGSAVKRWRGDREPWLDTAVDALAASMLFDSADFDRAKAAKSAPTYESVARSLGVDGQMVRAWWDLRKLAEAAS